MSALQVFKKKGVHFVSLTEKIDTNSAVGIAIFSILASISQLERDLIADRVKIGLANARAKGRLIGRKKMRDSDLIRKLLKAGMSYRNISVVAKCSHGSVSAELVALRREEAAAKEKAQKEQEEKDRLIAEQKKIEENFNSALAASAEPKTHSVESSGDSKGDRT